MKSRFNRIGAFIYMPVFFLLINSLLFWVIGQPIITFITSSVEIFLLNEAPNFDEKVLNDVHFSDKKEGVVEREDITYPYAGKAYGKIEIKTLDLDEPLYFGDDDETLRMGAGQYIGSVFPGEKGTTLIGGHNSSDFGKLTELSTNDFITINTDYGHYEYTVYQKKIAKYNDKEVLALLNNSNDKRLILYTCFPVNRLGLTDNRLYIFAEYTSGPIINEEL